MFLLRYWSSDLDLEIASWFPFGVDYEPVSINTLHSLQLKRIAAMCMGMGSEFFFMTSLFGGCVGSLMRDNFYRSENASGVAPGFMMLLGYSPQMEKLLGQKLADLHEINAGVAFCSLWSKSLRLNSMKAIILVSESVLFDEEEFLDSFEAILADSERENRLDVAYFAEKFGYRRFHMAYETDDPLQLQISRLLFEMEFTETRRMVGPSTGMPFPPFFGVTLKI